MEWAESKNPSHTPNRKKTELRAQSAKLTANKNSVLQSIYGKAIFILEKKITSFIFTR